MFSQQHYNAIAKDIREQLTVTTQFYPHETVDRLKDDIENKGRYYGTEALVHLALRLAKRFETDNPRFDPLKFLDACSPDPDMYPLSELWEVE